MSLPAPTPTRLPEVDLLRGLTMLLMVFVNDLWTLEGVPTWMLHVAPDADGMGLSDTVFPAFLFIVGLSLPLATEARRAKGDGGVELAWHVVSRSLALIVMGLFLVNGENLNAVASGMSRHIWYLCCCTAILLIWNSYPRLSERKWVKLFRSAGIGILIYLAWLYRGGPEGATYAFKPHWWGILGLIGWAYLAGGLVTVGAGSRIGILAAAWVFFTGVCLLHHAHAIPRALYWIPEPIIGGTMTALVLGGVLAMYAFLHFRSRGGTRQMALSFLGTAGVLYLLYLWARPLWGLSKQHATPAWLFICSAITLTAFLLVHLVVDVIRKPGWLSFALPAGKDTLLTYFMPHYAYALLWATQAALPAWLLTGLPGLAKSAAFALLCSWAAAALARLGVKLKI
jgi:heparan-alpha-glucosaminide N-acetyltransferase